MSAVIPMVAEFPKTPDHLKATPVMRALVRNISNPVLTLAAIQRHVGERHHYLYSELCEIEGPQVAKAIVDALSERVAA